VERAQVGREASKGEGGAESSGPAPMIMGPDEEEQQTTTAGAERADGQRDLEGGPPPGQRRRTVRATGPAIGPHAGAGDAATAAEYPRYQLFGGGESTAVPLDAPPARQGPEEGRGGTEPTPTRPWDQSYSGDPGQEESAREVEEGGEGYEDDGSEEVSMGATDGGAGRKGNHGTDGDEDGAEKRLPPPADTVASGRCTATSSERSTEKATPLVRTATRTPMGGGPAVRKRVTFGMAPPAATRDSPLPLARGADGKLADIRCDQLLRRGGPEGLPPPTPKAMPAATCATYEGRR
jgi:hypothetical protein